LINLDADSPQASDVAISLLPDHTRVRSGRPGGTHTWTTLPAELYSQPGWNALLHQFYIAEALDWRGGNCIVLLPGSLWEPISHPEVHYEHISGPELPDVLDIDEGILRRF
jgi:hypothetical protein